MTDRHLEVTTRGDLEILITRSFDAPRALVWEAMTKPEHLMRWLFGPPGWTMVVCEEDQRAGGSFRWAWSGPEGAEMSMHGVYKEVEPPIRLARTETFDTGCDAQAGEQTAVLELTEHGGMTALTLTVSYPTKAARDAALSSGMEQGMEASYHRLDEFLESMVAEHSGS